MHYDGYLKNKKLYITYSKVLTLRNGCLKIFPRKLCGLLQTIDINICDKNILSKISDSLKIL